MSPPGSVINISGTSPVDDPEYRYKMPVVYGKIEGRGNGIKTVIPNITDVALSLHRGAGEVNKFFGCELGAQTTYNEDTDRAVVNGAHTDAVLQTSIHRYIEKFVLCPHCRLPETDYKIKSDCIYHRCAACGAKDMLDMTHKLCTYILAQDKKTKKESKVKEKSKDKKKSTGGSDEEERKKKKKDNNKEKADSDEGGKKKKKDKNKEKEKFDSDEGGKKKKKDKTKKDKKKTNEKKDSKDVCDENGDLIDDVDSLSVGSETGVDDAGAMDLAVKGTKKFIREHPDAKPSEIAEAVVNQQMTSVLKSHDKIHILIQAIITPNFYKQNEIKTYSPVIQAVTQKNPIMERHLISAVEAICVDKPKNFPVLIKQLFDEDGLEEDVILEWACDGRSEYTLDSVHEETRAALRGEAEPVIVWLQEEDSSDDESDKD